MMNKAPTLILLAAALGAATAPANATPAPKATPTPKAKPVVFHLPAVPLHSEFTVEVNAKGQVVRVQGAKGDNKYPMWNAQTYGNVLQMWIRHPDGTAQVGLYRVTYDYDPKTKKVHRDVNLLSPGGSWANTTGAADQMMKEAQDEARAAHENQAKNLPPLENIVGPTPAPSPSAT